MDFQSIQHKNYVPVGMDKYNSSGVCKGMYKTKIGLDKIMKVWYNTVHG